MTLLDYVVMSKLKLPFDKDAHDSLVMCAKRILKELQQIFAAHVQNGHLVFLVAEPYAMRLTMIVSAIVNTYFRKELTLFDIKQLDNVDDQAFYDRLLELTEDARFIYQVSIEHRLVRPEETLFGTNPLPTFEQLPREYREGSTIT